MISHPFYAPRPSVILAPAPPFPLIHIILSPSVLSRSASGLNEDSRQQHIVAKLIPWPLRRLLAGC